MPRLRLRLRSAAIFILPFLAMSSASAADSTSPWPLFAMDNGVGRGTWTPPRQASTLAALGYDGISYNYTNPADLAVWRHELAARRLRLVALYFPVRLDGPSLLPAGFVEAVAQLRGSDTVLWPVIPNPRLPGDHQARALAAIREVADLAADAGLRVALYPHKDSYPATAEQALDLVLHSGRANLGLTVNLAHELAAGNGPRLPGIVRRAAPLLTLVTVNGATDRPAPGWTNHIKRLGDGEYDVAAVLRALRDARYTGPVGVQFYNVPGDPDENLAAARRAWDALTADLAHDASLEPHANARSNK
jgi:sugar phosphate isomerase/epimerase